MINNSLNSKMVNLYCMTLRMQPDVLILIVSTISYSLVTRQVPIQGPRTPSRSHLVGTSANFKPAHPEIANRRPKLWVANKTC